MAAKKKTVFDIARAKIMSQRRVKLNIKSFSPTEKSIRGRVAEFLSWGRIKYPHQIFTYEEITQAIFGLGRVPQAGSKSVKSVKGQMSDTGKLLINSYKTSLVTVRGVGARAAVDDVDILRESVTKDAERHRQTANKLRKTAGLVSPEKLQEELKGLKGDPIAKEELIELSKWFNESLSKYVKSLERPSNTIALLPPPPQS